MSAAHFKISLKFYVTFALLFGLFLSTFLVEGQTSCTVTDNHPKAPVNKTYKGFGQEATCKKALVMCSYFSYQPEKCQVALPSP